MGGQLITGNKRALTSCAGTEDENAPFFLFISLPRENTSASGHRYASREER